MMDRCPSHEQLLSLLDQESDSEDRIATRAHVESCSSCQEKLLFYRDQSDVDAWRRSLRGDRCEIDADEQLELGRFLDKLKRELPRHGEPSALTSQMTLGNYVLLEKLGEGGMGIVFKARHWRMDRIVALKVLPDEIIASPDAIARFRREVRAAARLSHPNLVTAFDADEVAGVHFLVMEFVQGMDLSRYVKQHGPCSTAEAVHLILEAARGLEYAHSVGVIHRDIKPSNLMRISHTPAASRGTAASRSRPATVKVLDLGLAGFCAHPDSAETHESQSGITQTGAVMGTVDYMSPEQALETSSADARSDIYSLGCTLHFLLTGQRAFQGDSFPKSLVAHREQPVPSLIATCGDMPLELDAAFQKMLAKNPDARFQSMGEVIEALTPLATVAHDAYQSSTPQPDVAQQSGHRMIAGVVAASVLLLITLVVLAGFSGRNRSPGTAGSPPERLWQPGSADRVIPGMIPQPAALPGIDGWQVETFAPRDKVVAAEWSPDGRFVAFGGADRQIRIYAVESGRLVQLLAGHQGEVRSLDWHPTRSQLASAAKDGTARVWDVDHGIELSQYVYPRNLAVTHLVWNPNGSKIAIAGTDSSIHIWCPGTDTEPTMLVGHDQAVPAVCWSPDGTRLATGSRDQTFRVWSVGGTLEYASSQLGYGILTVDWHPDGERIAVGGDDKVVHVCRPDGTNAQDLDAPLGGTFALRWSRDGQLAAGGMNRGGHSVHVWDRDLQRITTLNAGNHVESLAWSPLGTSLAVSDWDACAIVSIATGLREMYIPSGESIITDLAWNRDGTQLAAATNYERIRRLSDDGRQARSLANDSIRHPRAVRWLNEADIVSAHLAGGTIVYWSGDSIDRQVTVFPDITSPQMVLDVRPVDGRIAAARGSKIRLVLADGTRQELPTTGTGAGHRVSHLAWNPALMTLASSDAGGSILLWSDDGVSRELLQVEPGPNACLAWHPAGLQLAVAVRDQMWLVDPAGSPPIIVKSPSGEIEAISWSKRGVLASASDDGKIHFWDDQGTLQTTIAAHQPENQLSIAWHPNSRYVATGGRDAILRVWDFDSGDLVWTVVLLPGDHFATFDGGGQLLHGGIDEIDSHLVYTIASGGSRRLLTPRQFFARFQQ